MKIETRTTNEGLDSEITITIKLAGADPKQALNAIDGVLSPFGRAIRDAKRSEVEADIAVHIESGRPLLSEIEQRLFG